MRQGYTTGSCATAGAVAAAMLLINGKQVSEVNIVLPGGSSLEIPIKECKLINHNMAQAVVIKDGGDDPDVTNGLEIVTSVVLTTNSDIQIKGGIGVGKVTLPGLQLEVGEWAINPVPRKSIKDNLKRLFAEQGLEVIVEVPKGKETAKRTLNEKLGIVGGISILGTTGIVRPMSDDAYKNSLVPQLDVIKAKGSDTVVLVPGGIGEKQAVNLRINDQMIAQMSNYVGFLVAEAATRDFNRCILVGHHSKLTKVAGGALDTHNQRSDGRRETLAAIYALFGGKPRTIEKILDSVTSEEALKYIEPENRNDVYSYLCTRAAKTASEYAIRKSGKSIEVGCIMLTLKGEILGCDSVGSNFLEELNT